MYVCASLVPPSWFEALDEEHLATTRWMRPPTAKSKLYHRAGFCAAPRQILTVWSMSAATAIKK